MGSCEDRLDRRARSRRPLLALGRVALFFACAGAAAVPGGEVGPAGAEQAAEVKQAARKLRSPEPSVRRRAVGELAALDRREAWELVIEALEDESAEVADEAQLRVAEVRDPQLVRALLGRDGLTSRDEWVRLRVAEAFGRSIERVDGERLAQALRPRETGLSRAIAWSLERLARAGRLDGERGRIARRLTICEATRLDPHLRASALSARVAVLAPVESVELDPGLVLELEQRLSDRAAAVRCAALALVVRYLPGRGERAARELLGDDDPSVRAAALAAIAAHPTRTGLLALCTRLEVEARSRLLQRLVQALRAATGMKFGSDPRPWRRWLEGRTAGWDPPRRADDSSAHGLTQAARGRSTAQLAGLPIHSDRVAFLVDLSGSLWHERAGERTHKEVVDAALRVALEALPPEARFNVIPYTSRPHPWRDELAPAGRREVKDALRRFERCRETGTGNVFDAVLHALGDPEVDTVVILTDGAPTGGRRWSLSLMTDLLVEETRYRDVAFDSLLVGASRGLRRHWESLAQRTGGSSHALEWDPEQGVRPARE